MEQPRKCSHAGFWIMLILLAVFLGFSVLVNFGLLIGMAVTHTPKPSFTQRGGEDSEVFAPRPDVALYTWMVSEAATSLMADRPLLLHARASCPVLQSALLANHFRTTVPEVPIHVWPKGVWDRAASLHITLNHSDGPFLPYEPELRAAAKPPA